jgi:hypothetical protein
LEYLDVMAALTSAAGDFCSGLTLIHIKSRMLLLREMKKRGRSKGRIIVASQYLKFKERRRARSAMSLQESLTRLCPDLRNEI